jgi:hypothetical protein
MQTQENSDLLAPYGSMNHLAVAAKVGDNKTPPANPIGQDIKRLVMRRKVA